MKHLTLNRESPTATETRGRLSFADHVLYTIERPWIPSAPGGEPFYSCVPAGDYKLTQFTRPNGDTVVALSNAGLGVYFHQAERDQEGAGRYLILIHAANWADQVNGCIAPGLARGLNSRGPMVTQSRNAMEILMGYIAGDDDASISIIGENTYAIPADSASPPAAAGAG